MTGTIDAIAGRTCAQSDDAAVNRPPIPSVPEEHYAALVEALLGAEDVTIGSPGKQGFGSAALQSGGKIFAMLVKGRLVVKLPQPRVEALVASGHAERFDPGHGRRMKEWVSVEPTRVEEWLPLAREALAFVASRR